MPPGGVIGAALGNRPIAIAAFLACVHRGHPFLPIDNGTTLAEISRIAGRLDVAALMLSVPRLVTKFGRHFSIDEGVTLAVADTPPSGAVHGATILKLTSGSTGLPRAVLVTESELVSDSRTLMQAMDIRAGDIQIAAIPLSHAYGVGNLLMPLLLQGTAVVMREAFVPHRVPADARAVGARLFPGVPYMFEHFVNNPPPDGWPPTLTKLLAAGARLERDTVDRFRALFGVKVHSFYGTTETGGICYDDSDEPVEDGTVGRPLPGVSVTLVPHEAAAAGVGRVLVHSAAVTRGYTDGGGLNAFVAGGFLTGDLGYFNDRGSLCLTGRVSSFVNIAGRKVQPDEVEQVLRTFKGCADARVIGLADVRRGEQLVAALVMTGAAPSVITLRQFCGARLASYKIPRAFVFLDAIPLTERGKTDRQRLVAAVRELLNTQADML